MTETIETIALPLLAEELTVDRQRRDTARVQVHVRTTERSVQVDEALTQERVEVTRVPIGRMVERMPPVREEDGVTIIPVVEEVLVVERRLVLREEVHLRRYRTVEKHEETVVLRQQEASVERHEL